MLDYEKYVEESKSEVLVSQNPAFCVIGQKSDFKKQRKSEGYTVDDLVEPNRWTDCYVVFNNGKCFQADLGNAMRASDKDIAEQFMMNGYIWVGDDYHPTYITATGKFFDSYKEGEPRDVMSHNEIARGKLYGAFLKALEENKLKEFLSRPELLTKTNSTLMSNPDLKVKLLEAIKFSKQDMLVKIDDQMSKEGKTQEEIDKKCESVVRAAKKHLKMLEGYFEQAELKISTPARKSNVEKYQAQINEL